MRRMRTLGLLGLLGALSATAGGLQLVMGDAGTSGSAQTGTTTLLLGGITGPLGYLGNATAASGDYGHDITGAACNGNDSKTQENNLEVTCTWTEGTARKMNIDATAALTGKTYSNSWQEHSCPIGPPSLTGTSTITLYKPVVGTSGGTAVAGSSTVSLGTATNGSTGPAESAEMEQVAWEVNPLDPDTRVRIISSKVKCVFEGTAVEVKAVSNKHTAKATLTVTVTNQ